MSKEERRRRRQQERAEVAVELLGKMNFMESQGVTPGLKNGKFYLAVRGDTPLGEVFERNATVRTFYNDVVAWNDTEELAEAWERFQDEEV